ncbi:MAG: methanogenesis marker 16 metalloprotein [Methanophagales archaeon]|nr:methanogenesis marker 16 metalloprotein [Methanophagales archaeon]
MDKLRSVAKINEKIKKGEAVVLTAEEFKQMLRNEELATTESVDVVTCATCAIMSGTAAILSIPIAERNEFERADKVWLNGIPAFPGPCPNERLGIVDVFVYGTARANHEYGGGHLFREIVEGKQIEVIVKTGDRIIERKISNKDLQFARMITTRSSFKNYMAFVNPEEGEVGSIFSLRGLKGPYKEISVTGSGEINPLENDPMLKTIGIGTRIMVNGATGYVIGEGTRSSEEKPNLSVTANMREMDAEFMGGFVTSTGPECITSIAVPIPVINDDVFSNLKIMDEEIKLPIADIHDRIPFVESNYAAVWQNTDLEIRFDAHKCVQCDVCDVEEYCPTNAFSRSKGFDACRCFNCGACIFLCPEGAFKGNLGRIKIYDKDIPITLRQSNRSKANELARKLKNQIVEREFMLTAPVDYLR